MDAARERLAFLLETVALEAEHLQATDQRLFAEAFTAERAATLRDDAMLARRPDLLAEAVNEAHRVVPMLVQFVQACQALVASRQLI